MLFPFATIFSALIFILGLIYLYFSLWIVTPANEIEYKDLMENTNTKVESSAKTSYVAKQLRINMQKQIFYQEGSQRLEMQIFASKAELVFDHQDDTTSIVEEMQDVRCFIQEALFVVQPKDHTMQRILYLEAVNARYDYKSERIIAEKVKLSRYVLPGSTLIVSIEGLVPTMAGEAESAEFDLAGGTLHFKASHFKAILYQKEDETSTGNAG